MSFQAADVLKESLKWLVGQFMTMLAPGVAKLDSLWRATKAILFNVRQGPAAMVTAFLSGTTLFGTAMWVFNHGIQALSTSVDTLTASMDLVADATPTEQSAFWSMTTGGGLNNLVGFFNHWFPLDAAIFLLLAAFAWTYSVFVFRILSKAIAAAAKV